MENEGLNGLIKRIKTLEEKLNKLEDRLNNLESDIIYIDERVSITQGMIDGEEEYDF